MRPRPLPAPNARDLKLASEGVYAARRRVWVQNCRVNKRQREIDAFDSDALAYAR